MIHPQYARRFIKQFIIGDKAEEERSDGENR